MTIVPSRSVDLKCILCKAEKPHLSQGSYTAPACMDCADALSPYCPSRKVCQLCGTEKNITHFDTLCGTPSRACIPCVSALPPIPSGTRRCSACFEGKPLEDFPAKGGWCILCAKSYRTKHRKENYSFERQRARHLQRTYGITLDEYELMLFQQGGVCAACGKPETATHHSGRIKSMAVDHHHVTGQVRGLLCQACNQLLGHLENDPQRIKALQKYLKKYT